MRNLKGASGSSIMTTKRTVRYIWKLLKVNFEQGLFGLHLNCVLLLFLTTYHKGTIATNIWLFYIQKLPLNSKPLIENREESAVQILKRSRLHFSSTTTGFWNRSFMLKRRGNFPPLDTITLSINWSPLEVFSSQILRFFWIYFSPHLVKIHNKTRHFILQV